jgi:AAA+ superfamily predicted ATPase
MCTNRYDALDPAVKRRAAEILTFTRPGEEQRRLLLGRIFAQLNFQPHEIEAMVSATGPRNGHPGFTYSDLVQRLIPAIVLDAYPERPIKPARAVELAQQMQPTAPFQAAESRRM